jgi:hypothetical protein
MNPRTAAIVTEWVRKTEEPRFFELVDWALKKSPEVARFVEHHWEFCWLYVQSTRHEAGFEVEGCCMDGLEHLLT